MRYYLGSRNVVTKCTELDIVVKCNRWMILSDRSVITLNKIGQPPIKLFGFRLCCKIFIEAITLESDGYYCN
jgi:hypothetical protein